MNFKKFIISYITISLIAITLFSVFVLTSCEKELSVPPEPAFRNLVGIIQDKTTGQRIPNAFVTIKPAESEKVFQTTSDAMGAFSLNAPVYPSSTPYHVYVSANGYLPADTVVQCNCDVLEVGLVLMTKPLCGVEFSPSNIVNFDTVNAGITRIKNIWIKNPTLVQVRIDSLSLLNSNYSFSAGINLPYQLMAGDSVLVTLNFSPKTAGSHNDTLKVYTNCPQYSVIPAFLLAEAVIADCGLQISPSDIDFGVAGVGDTLRRTITLSTPYQTPVVVDSVKFIPPQPDVVIDPVFLNQLPVTVTNGNPISFTVTVIPSSSGQFAGTLAAYSSTCENEASYSSNFRGSVFDRLCEVRPDSISIGRTPGDIRLSFGFPNYTFVIRNLSSSLPLTIQYLRIPNAEYFDITPGAPITINPLDSVNITITYKKIFVGTLRDTLVVVTDGSCGARIPIIAQYQNQGYQGASLFRWSNVPNLSNPDAIFNGFRFADSSVVTDSVSICPFDSTFISPTSSADLRFDGIVYMNFGERFARLRAVNGMKYLGNAQDENLEFIKSNWQPRIVDPNGDWSNLNGCSETIQDGLFKRGDVIAVKERNNTLSLMMVQSIETTIVEGYEFIYFLFITL